MLKDSRFDVGNTTAIGSMRLQIIVDKETGINYLFCQNGNTGGLTPLLDEEGKPVVTRENSGWR